MDLIDNINSLTEDDFSKLMHKYVYLRKSAIFYAKKHRTLDPNQIEKFRNYKLEIETIEKFVYDNYVNQKINEGFFISHSDPNIHIDYLHRLVISRYNKKLTNSAQNPRESLVNKINNLEISDEYYLYPILYSDFPNPDYIVNNTNSIIVNLIQDLKIENSPVTEDELLELILIFQEGTYSHKYFLYVNYLICKFHTKEGGYSKSIPIQNLERYLNDPLRSFYSLTNFDSVQYALDFNNTSFEQIVREVCRDNIITDKEREYLYEKARENFVDTHKLDKYLNNPFVGFETFKLFVDEICADGIVTTVEREYIEEKADQYNVSSSLLEKMIKSGLAKVSRAKEIEDNKAFEEFVLIYLFANVYQLHSIEHDMFEEYVSDNFIVDLEFTNEYYFDELCSLLFKKSEYALYIEEIKHFSIFMLVDALGITIGDFSSSNDLKNKEHHETQVYLNKQIEKVNEEKIIKINNRIFIVKEANNPFSPLFFYEFDRMTGDHILRINISHHLYKNKNVDLIIKFAASIFDAKLTMTNPKTDRYISRILNNIELIENE
ncbi:hypothetical protein OAK19_06685 [Aureispira]|nr:hypothetical protein [Aureispira sp.]